MEGLRINICERFKQKVTQHKKGENQRENRLGQQIILPQQSSATNPKQPQLDRILTILVSFAFGASITS